MALNLSNRIVPIKFLSAEVLQQFLAGRVIGAKKPSGSYTELVKERMPQRVFGLSLRSTLKVNLSLSISHLSPNVR